MYKFLTTAALTAAILGFASHDTARAQYPGIRTMPYAPPATSYRPGYGSPGLSPGYLAPTVVTPSYWAPSYTQPSLYPRYDHDYDVLVRTCPHEPFTFFGRYETRSAAERAARTLEYRGYDASIRVVHDHPRIYR